MFVTRTDIVAGFFYGWTGALIGILLTMILATGSASLTAAFQGGVLLAQVIATLAGMVVTWSAMAEMPRPRLSASLGVLVYLGAMAATWTMVA